MKRKLTDMFDFQKFHKNKHLAELIEDTNCRYEADTDDDNREMSDDDLDLVNAAGSANYKSHSSLRNRRDKHE